MIITKTVHQQAVKYSCLRRSDFVLEYEFVDLRGNFIVAKRKYKTSAGVGIDIVTIPDLPAVLLLCSTITGDDSWTSNLNEYNEVLLAYLQSNCFQRSQILTVKPLAIRSKNARSLPPTILLPPPTISYVVTVPSISISP